MKILRCILAPFLALCFALAPAPAGAFPPARTAAVLSGVQGWSFQGSSADLYFSRNGGSCTINRILKPCASLFTITRASAEMAPWQDQHWTSFASGTVAITDFGLSMWQAGTNTALQARDMTQAAWVKVNMTTALTATGIDNAVNSATTLTATAGNATVLQTLTIGSSAETFSIFIERVSGTGNIQITENNGGTWTTATSSNCVNTQQTGTAINPSTFVRCSVEATLANPVIGVRIVTSGDVVNVDFAQNEAGPVATPPILTTTVSAARAADNIPLVGSALTAALASKAAYAQTNAMVQNLSNSNNIIVFFPTGAQALRAGGTGTFTADNAVNSQANGNLPSGTFASRVKSAYGYDSSSYTAIANGGTQGSTASPFGSTGTTAVIGNRNTDFGRPLNGYLERLAFGATKGQYDRMTIP